MVKIGLCIFPKDSTEPLRFENEFNLDFLPQVGSLINVDWLTAKVEFVRLVLNHKSPPSFCINAFHHCLDTNETAARVSDLLQSSNWHQVDDLP
jgi:hypothetical protein